MIPSGEDEATMATLKATEAALVEKNDELASSCLRDLNQLLTAKMKQQVFTTHMLRSSATPS